MSRLARPAALALLGALALGARAAEPVAVLGRPGLAGRFHLLSDGSVRRADGLRIGEWLPGGGSTDRPPEAPPVELSWLAPGARVVQAASPAGAMRVTTCSGADGHGPVGRQALYLFRSVRVIGDGPGVRQVRLCVGLSRPGLVLRDGSTLLDGETVLLLVSRAPDEVQAREAETVLVFDLAVAGESGIELFLAVPALPTEYRLRDVPDVRNLKPDVRLRDIVQAWEARVLSGRLAVGSPGVTEAFHAAVGALLLDRPSLDDPAALAVALSGLARAGLVHQLPRAVETLVTEQAEDGRFAGALDVGVQADLTTALADCALYADAPNRWAQLLWRPLARAAAGLEAAETPASAGSRTALALSRVAEVARFVEESPRAEELTALAQTRLAALSDAVPTTLAEARARALSRPETPSQPPALSEGSSLREVLLSAYVAAHVGDEAARRRAWDGVERRLEAQPLPGATMSGESEDPEVAAALVFLVAESLIRAEAGAVHVFPALPGAWVQDGRAVSLTDFPSGLGPLGLEAARAPDGPLSLSLSETPKPTERLLLSPPLGMEVDALRANGRPVSPESLAAGPPWSFDPSVLSLTLSKRGRSPFSQ